MTSVKRRESDRADRLVEEAMVELGLAHQDESLRLSVDRQRDERSLSDITVERFRQEYEKRVRAAAAG